MVRMDEDLVRPRLSGPPREGRRTLLVCCVAFASMLALVLGLRSNGRNSLWLDEAVSVRLAQIPWPAFVDMILGREANSAVYFLLLRGWVGLGGDGEMWVRSLSALVFAATVPGLYWLGAQLGMQRAGVAAALLFAVSPAGVLGAQEARGFALESCLLVFAAVCLVKALANGGAHQWIAWVLLSILATWVHLLAVLVPISLVVVIVARRRRATPHAAVVGISCVFIGAALVAYAGLRGGQGAPGFLVGKTLANAVRLPLFLTGGSLALFTWTACAGVASLTLALRARRSQREPGDWFGIQLLLAWLILPCATALLISTRSPIFHTRYFLYELAPLLLLTSSAVQHLTRRLAISFVVVSVLVSGFALRGVYSRPPTADWRAATQLVEKAGSAEDGIIFNPPFERIPFQYYMDASETSADKYPQPTVPADPWALLPVEDYATVQQALTDPRALFRPGQSVWVVGSGRSEEPDIVSAVSYLNRNARVTFDTQVPGIRVQRYDLSGRRR